ncbi:MULTISPECIES: hypothetical protein [Bacillus]|uniref:Group-specific protein n=4 Tax=Bacillus cereus group TaxID=86661 RepID=Q816A3_BACCR|nr:MULTISPECIES: hypothetical protein [Bacillus]TKV44844.1 hypothetical protein C1I58_25820 [Bacillus sp. PIC28]AAP11842.1 hypothetical protein BC_4970 [Bacillus cereus ATCC 14579]AOM08043.1 hypothetical protein FORC24_4753 [Bacillus cereus]ATI62089.1 hypothetical protein CPZ31_25035 [Bacillus cereus]AZR79725.1 hypothetical protein BtSCAC15_27295 [Bacillus thuringiensis]
MNKMICIVFSLCFFIHLSTTYAESNQKLNYPSNRNKSFVSEDVFYKQLDKKIYKEYKNAAYSVRKKILFKEVPDEEFSFLQKTAVGCRGRVVLQDFFVHSDRQVYFFTSFIQNEVGEFHKYIVIDAETKRELQEGKSYHPYKK